MNRRTKILGAVIAVLSLSLPLAGCDTYKPDAPPEAAESAPAEEVTEEVVEEEVVDEEVADGSAGEAALWYVEAARGEPEAWEKYDAGDMPQDALEYEKEITDGALEMMLDEPITEKQEKAIYAAMDEAYSRIKIEVEEEDVSGDSGTVTVAIWGVNYEEGGELAGESPEGVDMFLDADSSLDDLFVFVMEKTWELAPLAEEPILIEIPMTQNEDGQWVPDTSELMILDALLEYAFKDETESVERLLDMYDD